MTALRGSLGDETRREIVAVIREKAAHDGGLFLQDAGSNAAAWEVSLTTVNMRKVLPVERVRSSMPDERFGDTCASGTHL
jgi:hypothetical protein